MSSKKAPTKKTQDSVAALFFLYSQAREKAEKAREAYQALDRDASLIRDKLVVMIPNNAVIDGVEHKHFERRSVSYAEALKQVTDRLVPKTKVLEVQVIIEENTKVISTDKIELAK